jgi:acetyltransferase-like isoleucine patch superfamily enzyme
MITKYGDNIPHIDPDAWVAPDATVCGDVTIGAVTRIMHGARLVAEAGGSIRIARTCIVLENAVVRATSNHPCTIGDHCFVGPNSHVVGADIGDEVFIATGAAGSPSVIRPRFCPQTVTRRSGRSRSHSIFQVLSMVSYRETPDLMRAITTRLSQRLGVHRSETSLSNSA